MHLQRNFYEVLGLPQGATQVEIKKRYRELARKFHPDITKDKKLGQKIFTQINQAYRALGDIERRAEYDSTLQPPTNTRVVSNSAPVDYTTNNGFSAGARSVSSNNSAAARPQIKPVAKKPIIDVARFLSEADKALMEGKATEAKALCEKILIDEPANAKALGILGDALTQLNETDAAAEAYLQALRIAPSPLLEAKLNRLRAISAASQKRAAINMTNGKTADKPEPPPQKSVGGKLFGRIMGRK